MNALEKRQHEWDELKSEKFLREMNKLLKGGFLNGEKKEVRK